MSKGRDRTVYRRKDGLWANKRDDADRASSLHETQTEANRAAAEMLRNQGGGERTAMGRGGRIVSKDTIPPGNDPNPPRRTRSIERTASPARPMNARDQPASLARTPQALAPQTAV